MTDIYKHTILVHRFIHFQMVVFSIKRSNYDKTIKLKLT